MKRRLVFLLLSIGQIAFSQVKVSQPSFVDVQGAALQLARKITGPNIPIFNATITGDTRAIGFFTDKNKLIGASGTISGLSEGVILSTGFISDAEGPNVNFKNTILNTPKDPDITALLLATGTIFSPDADAISLEFDFMPLKNSISIPFVFASEHYSDILAGPGLGDLFCVFLNPVGFPKRNIATITGISSISGAAINQSVNNQYYVDNNTVSNITSYDGFTKVLTAKASLNVCQLYHIKIVISDIADGGLYDSGVFIGEGDFGAKRITTNLPDFDNKAIALCSDDQKPFLFVPTTTGATFQWYYNNLLIPGATGVFIQTTFPGIYEVNSIINPTIPGCSWSDSVSLSIGQTFSVLGINAKTCTEDSMIVRILPEPGNYTIFWTSGGNTLPGLNGLFNKVKPQVTTDYTAFITNTGGCTKAKTVTAVVNPLLFQHNVSISSPTACYGQPVTVTSNTFVKSAGGGGYVPAKFLAPGVFSLDSFKVEIRKNGALVKSGYELLDLATISGKYTATLQSKNGCYFTDSLDLNVERTEIIASADTAFCIGNRANLTVSGAAVYSWSPDVAISNTTSSGVVVSPSTSIIYTVSGVSGIGLNCADTKEVKITVHPLPEIIKTPDTVVCKGSYLQLSVTGVAAIKWDSLNTTDLNPQVKIWRPQNFGFIGTSIFGCSKSDVVKVGLKKGTTINSSRNPVICKGAQTLLVSGSASDYKWVYNNSLVSTLPSFMAKPEYSGYYFLFANNGECISKDSVWINVRNSGYQKMIEAASINVCKPFNQYPELTGPEGYTYNWGNGITTRSIIATVPGVYHLMVTDKYLCRSTDSIIVVAKCDQLFIPQVFTPNDDSFNETFEIIGLPNNSNLQIFNRWGKRVFATENYDNQWKGEGLPEGTYFYSLTLGDSGVVEKGWVVLTR